MGAAADGEPSLPRDSGQPSYLDSRAMIWYKTLCSKGLHSVDRLRARLPRPVSEHGGVTIAG